MFVLEWQALYKIHSQPGLYKSIENSYTNHVPIGTTSDLVLQRSVLLAVLEYPMKVRALSSTQELPYGVNTLNDP